MVEQSLKAAAAAAARVPASISSAALNLATQQANVNAFTNATMPIMAAVAAAAANPLSSLPNSFFTAVDTSQTTNSIHHNNSFHPNVTAVSATFVIPSTSNSISMPATSFHEAYEIPKTSAYNNYFNNSDIIPSTSSQLFNTPLPPKTLPTDIFNVSAMLSPQQATKLATSHNDILYSTASAVLQNTSANHMPTSQTPFQVSEYNRK